MESVSEFDGKWDDRAYDPDAAFYSEHYSRGYMAAREGFTKHELSRVCGYPINGYQDADLIEGYNAAKSEQGFIGV